MALLTRRDAKAAFAAEASRPDKPRGIAAPPAPPEAPESKEDRQDAGTPPPVLRAAVSGGSRVRLWATVFVWTAVVVGACVYLLPPVMMEWWPWAYDERWEIGLKPQSGAYPKITLSGERRLYCWGQCGADPNRLISRKPWIATAKIHGADSGTSATLSLDAFREQWSWTTPAGEVRHSQDEVRPEFVLQCMKDVGIDVGKSGAQEEAAALIGLLKDAANGVLPGDRRPRDYHVGHGARIGPFAYDAMGGWGYHPLGMVGLPLDMDRNQVARRWIAAVVFLAIWLPGLMVLARRRRRRLAAVAVREKEPEQRYQHVSEVKTEVEAIRGETQFGPGTGDSRTPGRGTSKDEVTSQCVQGVGASLFFVGLATLLIGLGIALWCGTVLVQIACLPASSSKPGMTTTVGHPGTGPFWWLLAAQFLAAGAGTVVMLAGASLRRLEFRKLATAGSVIAMIPLSPAWLLSLPLGLWAMFVIRRPEVEAAFDRPARIEGEVASGGAPGGLRLREQLGTTGILAAIISMLGALATFLPWGSVSIFGATFLCFGCDLWYGIVAGLTFLAVFLVIVAASFLRLRRFWLTLAMVMGGTVVVAVTGAFFWKAASPVTVTAGPATTIGNMEGMDVAKAFVSETLDTIRRGIGQGASLGSWLASALGLGLFIVGCVSIRGMRRDNALPTSVPRRPEVKAAFASAGQSGPAAEVGEDVA